MRRRFAALLLPIAVAAFAAPPSAYLTWQDPAEHAFTVSLPSAWRLSGGTQRNTRIDVHYVVRAQSPSGGAQLFLDDPRILVREIPGPATIRIGIREGQIIPAPDGTKLLVERYKTGAQMAEDYARKSLCEAPSQFRGGMIPAQTEELNRQFGPIAQAEGKRVHLDAGEVSFKCGDRNGYVYAITAEAAQPGQPISMWAVYRIGGYLATTDETPAAAAAINHALGTFEMNQQWLQAYARECGDIAGNSIRESNALTQSTIARSREMTDASIANVENMRKNSNAQIDAINRASRASNGGSGTGTGHDYNQQLGTKSVCDDLGRCQTVDASVTNWWSDCSGTFHPGSDTGATPPSSQSACWSKGH
jgi:hypothetical protein